MEKIINYLFEKESRPISLIWSGEKEFDFMCWHYINFAESMGFDSYDASKLLKMIKENSLPNQETLEHLIKLNYFDENRLQQELSALKDLKSSSKLPVGGGCFGPLTVASAIIGVEKTIQLSRKDPEFLEATLSFVTEHMITLAKEESTVGMDFWIAEPLASLFPPKLFYKFCGKYLKAIFDAIDEPGFLHVCGKTVKHTQAMVNTGAQVLSIDYSSDIFECIRMVPDDVIIMGNLDPMLLKYGSKKEIEEATRQINDACKNYKNFIFSTGCSIPEETPIENIHVAIASTELYKIYSNDEYQEIRRLTKAFLTDEICYKAALSLSKKYLVDIAYEESELIRTIDRRYNNGNY